MARKLRKKLRKVEVFREGQIWLPRENERVDAIPVGNPFTLVRIFEGGKKPIDFETMIEKEFKERAIPANAYSVGGYYGSDKMIEFNGEIEIPFSNHLRKYQRHYKLSPNNFKIEVHAVQPYLIRDQ